MSFTIPTLEQFQILFGFCGISIAIAALLMFYYEAGQVPHRFGRLLINLTVPVIFLMPCVMYMHWYIPPIYIIEAIVPFPAGFFGTVFFWGIIKSFFKDRGLDFDKVSDIRDLKMPKSMFTYDVYSYWSGRHIMIGLEAETQKPLYVSQKEFNETHTQLTGTSGSGKTVAVQMIGKQWVRKKYPFIVIDPKKDKHLMHVMYWAARKAGVPYHYVDLNKGPQINLFLDTPPEEMEELMYAAFGLESKGTDADYYRGKDRKGARLAAKLMSQMSTPSMRGVLDEVVNPDLFPQGFCDQFEELAHLESINAVCQGVDFEAIVNGRGVLYVVGSIKNPQVKAAQDMITAKIIHMIERRNPSRRYPPAKIFFDEFKYSCSKPALSIFSAMRDKGLTGILAHQSNMDFNDISGINSAAIQGAVVDNTNLKIVYKVKHPDTVRSFAEMSGFKTVVLGQKRYGEKGMTYNEISIPLIEENYIYRLNKSMAVCYGLKDIAVVIGTSPQKARYHKKALLIKESALVESSLEQAPPVSDKPKIVEIDEFVARNKA